jgi:hypothetical protein
MVPARRELGHAGETGDGDGDGRALGAGVAIQRSRVRADSQPFLDIGPPALDCASGEQRAGVGPARFSSRST